MGLRGAALATSILLIGSPGDLARAAHGGRLFSISRDDAAAVQRLEPASDLPISVYPNALADLIDTLAGRSIRLLHARVVGVFSPQVFLVESQMRLRPLLERNRVLVFIEGGTLRVDAASLVAETVTVSGVARTLLGMRTSREVPWPAGLTRHAVERLDIRAAVLARSVRTPEGVDLLGPASPTSTATNRSPHQRHETSARGVNGRSS